MKTFRMAVLLVAVLVVGVLLMAACGGQTTTTAATTTTTLATTTTATTATTTTTTTSSYGTSTTTAGGTTSSAGTTELNVLETALAQGDFATLATALAASGLDQTLQSAGPYTVFAPNDEAFSKVPQSTLQGLLADPQGNLSKVLSYHVVQGKLMSTDLTDGMELKTVEGSTLKVTVQGGKIMVGGATIIQPDIQASNGVVHVIDTVLVPPDVTLTSGTTTSS